MTDTVNSTTLRTVNTTSYIDLAAFLGTINPDTNKIPKQLYHCYLNSFNFFFQAEDGIRGVAVTGVQTCALPIWNADPETAFSTAGIRRCRRTGNRADAISWASATAWAAPPISFFISRMLEAVLISRPPRSEERRVGKECRARGSPYHGKKQHAAE